MFMWCGIVDGMVAREFYSTNDRHMLSGIHTLAGSLCVVQIGNDFGSVPDLPRNGSSRWSWAARRKSGHSLLNMYMSDWVVFSCNVTQLE